MTQINTDEEEENRSADDADGRRWTQMKRKRLGENRRILKLIKM
jgi:hypothetical protein